MFIRSLSKIFIFLVLFLSAAESQVVGDTSAIWRFDETSGSLVRDDSQNHNNGTAFGTTIVAGRLGNARLFNGFSDYVSVADPPNGSLDFANGQSFTIEASFRTTTQTGEILRKGLAFVQGYDLAIINGRVHAAIGSRENGVPPDTVLRIRSAGLYNDGAWHKVTFVRDQSQRRVFLYVDDALATSSMTDPILFSLSNDRPLTIGRWEDNSLPTFYSGSIDEVKVLRGAQHPQALSDTVAIWHLDETSGSLVRDDSPNRNNGTAYGTTIVPGRFGSARNFSGSFDYIYVPYPGTTSMNFSSSQSFTVQAWFKTTQLDTGEFIRRGLAPVPGFLLRILNGHVQGVIGNREFSSPPDTLLRITSTQANYNDGQWHVATMVRDRALARLFLYVDGRQAAAPLNDNFPLALSNDRPLTMGAWENFVRPTFYRGALDEVTIFKGARHPVAVPSIEVSPSQLNFGVVPVGSIGTMTMQISNLSFSDTLRVNSIGSNNSVFSPPLASFAIPPGSSRSISVLYIPAVARTDTGSLSINSNDPNRPTVGVRVSGQGFAPSASPLVSSIRDIPEDQGKQVRVIWYRSIYDGINDSLRITQYNLWRRVGNANLWDFISTIPAVRFEQYAFVAPTLFDSSRAGIRWSVFRVSAHTANNAQVFFSVADSGYSVDNLPPLAPTNLIASLGNGRVQLGWDVPTDPDVETFGVYRSIDLNFMPSEQYRIGTATSNNFTDMNIGGSNRYYYYVLAFDSTGNQSTPSNQANVLVTSFGNGDVVPTDFRLYQNYPNPFNPSSIIRFDVPERAHVNITVYDMLGKAVAALVDEIRPAGTHSVMWNAGSLSTGTYLYRMQAGSYSAVKKLVLIK